MKWEKAIAKIEKALAEGANVGIQYHRKWMKNDSHIDDVDKVVTYDWHGTECKAINTFNDSIDEGSHIIDDVLTDHFFGIRFRGEYK